MTVSGLENNYYLAGNDIWIQVYGFSTQPQRIEISVTNNTTGVTLPVLRLFSPNTVYSCNISLPVRALQPDPNHISPNTMSSYTFTFTAYYGDPGVEDEAITVSDKYFIRGGVNKANTQEWYLSSGTNLLINKWLKWEGVTLPSQPHRIQAGAITTFSPSASQSFDMRIRGMCTPTIIKFLNSLGGYQYYVFEFAEKKLKTKGKGSVSRMAYRLRADRSRSIGRTEEEILILKTRTPEAVQDVYEDLIRSNDVLLYDPAGTDDASRWHRLELDQSNDAILNNRDRYYENEASFKLPNYVNRDL